MSAGTRLTRAVADGDSTRPAEVAISLDLVKRGLLASPLLIAVCAAIWGIDGAWSAAFALGIVLVNFVISAALIAGGAKIGVAAVMGAVLFGYFIRLGLILLAILLVRDQPWISIPALGVAMIVAHLGLLAWEFRHISLSLAWPGLKPAGPRRTARPTH